MSNLLKSVRLYQILLWLIAIHSFFVGILLIILPPNLMEFFGYDIQERFFQTQGGVFHMVMCVAYIMVATNVENGKQLSIFSYSAKFIATVFLVSYFFFADQIITVLLSGIGDFLMGIFIYLFYINIYKKDSRS